MHKWVCENCYAINPLGTDTCHNCNKVNSYSYSYQGGTSITKSNNYSTKVSELIKELQDILKNQGDLPVAVCNPEGHRSTRVHLYPQPTYYDGGTAYPKENPECHCSKWGTSRANPKEFGHTHFIYITSDCPSDGDFINDIQLPELNPNVSKEDWDKQYKESLEIWKKAWDSKLK